MNIRRNVTWNVVEVVLMMMTQFAIFRIIIENLGVSALGIWSLVFSTLSFVGIANVGVAGTLTRFIAKPPAEDDIYIPPLRYVETAFSTNLLLYSALVLIGFTPAFFALSWASHGVDLEMARHLLPYAMISFVVLNVSNISASALIGFKRSDIKSALSILALGVQLGISVLTIRRFGIVGLALAQIAQNLVAGILGWLQILRISRSGTYLKFPFRFNTAAFKEMIGFGIRLQALNVTSYLYDPATKFVLSAIAGPMALGMYEVAYRLVFQTRALIVAPAQNLPPMFAAIPSGNIANRRVLYQTSTALMLSVSVLGSIAVVLISPLVSLVLLGEVRWPYVEWVSILSAGWLVNVAAVPAYLMGVGCGWVRWNIVGMALSILVSCVCGYILGTQIGAVGVVIAAALGIGGGAIVVMVANCRIGQVGSPFPPLIAFRGLISELRNRALRATAQ